MKKYLYEVGVPVEETWVYRIEAYNEKEARAKAHVGDGLQICSTSGASDYVTRIAEIHEPEKEAK